MTAILRRPSEPNAAWTTMPGWGIVADLTPPELVAARGLRRLRRIIAIAMIGVVLLCVAGYVYAMLQESSASDDLAAKNDDTVALQAAGSKYAAVTQVQGAIDNFEAQLTALATNEIDTAKLLSQLRLSLPNTMSITSLNVSVTGATAAGGSATVPSLDTSGQPVIGTVTLAGTARSLNDLGKYVVQLSALRGVTNVIPSSNATGTAKTATWTLTLQLTNQLLVNQPSTASSTSPATGTTSSPGGS